MANPSLTPAQLSTLKSELLGGAQPSAPSQAAPAAPASGLVQGLTTYANGAAVTDLSAVQAAGYQFIRQKATEGTDFVDPTWDSTLEQALNLNFPIVPFHYFHPAMDAEAQASFYYDTASEANMPPSVDFETTDNLSPGQAVAQLADFETASEEQWGEYPTIYTNPSFWQEGYSQYLAQAQKEGKEPFDFSQAGLAIAQYDAASPTIPAPFSGATQWQAAKEISGVPGIEGHPDLEYSNPQGLITGLTQATPIASTPLTQATPISGPVPTPAQGIGSASSPGAASATETNQSAPSPSAETAPAGNLLTVNTPVGAVSIPGIQTPLGEITSGNIFFLVAGGILVVIGLIGIVWSRPEVKQAAAQVKKAATTAATTAAKAAVVA